MNKKLFQKVCAWQRATFRQATTLSKLAHLKKEIKEVEEDVLSDVDKKRLALEFADCFILLYGAADASGFSYEEIASAIEEKFKINKARKWGKPDADGVVLHVKEEAKNVQK